jgi:hypothetical protein
MAAGIPDTLWSVTDLVEMVDAAQLKPEAAYKKMAVLNGETR